MMCPEISTSSTMWILGEVRVRGAFVGHGIVAGVKIFRMERATKCRPYVPFLLSRQWSPGRSHQHGYPE